MSAPCALRPAEAGAVCLPKHGEEVAGDAWSCTAVDRVVTLLVADGLGHGPLAAEAARAAVAVFHQRLGQSPSDILADAHAALG